MGVALLATAAAVVAMVYAPKPELVKSVPPLPDSPVVTLQAEEVAPEAPKPLPPPPKPVTPPPLKSPKPLVPAVAPNPAPSPAPTPSPAPAPAPVLPPSPPVPVPAAPAPTPTPAPPPVNTAHVEATYVGRLRAYIRSITDYPTSGDARRLRPEGASVVRFTLSRDGALRQAEIEQGSGSPILDKQALLIVRGGKYPAWPADAWGSAETHTFTVTVQFVSP